MPRNKNKAVKSRLDIIVGKNIRTERDKRNITRDELADLLEVTTAHLGLMERGERGATIVTLSKLAEAFDLPIDNFLVIPSSKNVKLRDPDKKIGDNRKKIASLITRLTESELEFVIHVIKGVTAMRPPFDDDDGEEY